jgi:hypothetical protein
LGLKPLRITLIRITRTGMAKMASLIIDRTYADYKEEFRKKKLHDT